MSSFARADKKEIQGFPSILTINSTSNNTIINTGKRILRQPIVLQNFKVEFTSGNGAAKKLLYLDIPSFFNSSFLVDENPNRSYIPIITESADVSILVGLNLPIQLQEDVEEKFTVRLLDSDFTEVSNLVRYVAQFSFLT